MASSRRQPYVTHAEVTEPIETRIEGTIPSWLSGNFISVGPGLFEFGGNKAIYPMDGMGFLHSFQIKDGQAKFCSRLIDSDAYKKNSAAQRYVAAEFGTPVSPDPKQSLFSKLKATVSGGGDLSDNASHNVCYWKENDALMVLGHPVFVIDPVTLETTAKVTLPENLAIDIVTEHCYIDSDGTLFLLGSHVRGKPTYHIIKVPAKGNMDSSFAAAEIVHTVNGQFKMTPTSHHNFVMTENYFVVVECPLEINVLKILTKGTIIEALKWDPKETCKFHVFNKKTGKPMTRKIQSESMYLFHLVNVYEDGDHIVIDTTIFNKFNSHKDLFVSRQQLASAEYEQAQPWKKLDTNKAVRYVIPTNEEAIGEKKLGDNAVTLTGETAQAVVHKSHIQLTHRPLTAARGDIERVQYPSVNPALLRKKYTYMYAGGCGESEFLRFGVGKYNVDDRKVHAWDGKPDQILSEPLFVADPQGAAEDDGVLLFTMLDYAENNDRLVIVDAKSMTTIGQVFLDAKDGKPRLLPETDHGVFITTS